MEVTQTTMTSLQTILNETPAGQAAMFRVTRHTDDYVLGQNVVFKNGHAHLCMTGERVGIKHAGLHFVGYFNERNVL